jgi:hypothetical protein
VATTGTTTRSSRRIAIRGVAEVREHGEHAPVLRGSCSDAELPLRYQAEHVSLPRHEPVQSGAAGGHALDGVDELLDIALRQHHDHRRQRPSRFGIIGVSSA